MNRFTATDGRVLLLIAAIVLVGVAGALGEWGAALVMTLLAGVAAFLVVRDA